MCGIAGLYAPLADNRESILRSMTDVLVHRGPDDHGTFIDGALALGHQRLSIIDLEHGHQPMTTEDGRYTIVFNGEIYNYLELRRRLLQKGLHFRTHSDTEVLLGLYTVYGKDMLDQLNGMFAFAIHDHQKDTLFLARDHFGIKPLYYHESDDGFAFASEIKALLEVPWIKAEPDQHSLYEYLTFQFVLEKHTLFQNIHKLEPGCFLEVHKGQMVKEERYWTLNFEVDDSKTEDQYADELLVLLEHSLSLQMRSDVPVGTYLSGGLDSSAVTLLAKQHSYDPLASFSGGFKESQAYDETPHAQLVAERAGTDHHLIYPTHEDFLKHFEHLVWMMDEPEAGPGLFPQYMVSQLAAENVKVVLGGQGGDEIFGGYARYAVAYLEQCLKGAIFETQEEGQHIVTLDSIIDNLPILQQYVPLMKKQFREGLFDPMDTRYYHMIDRSPALQDLYREEFLQGRDETALFEKFSCTFNQPDTLSYFNKMTSFDMRSLLPGLLHVEDRVSMAVSLESRVPLLDKRIAELAAKMPPPMKFAGGKTKYMLLKALENIMPREIVERKDKMGFPVPLNEWLSGPLREYCLDLLTDDTAKNRGMLNTEKVETQINQEGQFSRNLWGALNLEVWFRKFIDQ